MDSNSEEEDDSRTAISYVTSTQKVDNFSTEVIVDGSYIGANWTPGLSPIIPPKSKKQNNNFTIDHEMSYELNSPKTNKEYREDNQDSTLSQNQSENNSNIRNKTVGAQSLANMMPVQINLNENKLFLIEPTGDEQTQKNFMNNDLAIAKALKNTIFENIGIKDIRKNIMRKILIIELQKNVDNTQLEEILDIKTLGSFDINCRLPQSKSITYGVIGPISLDANLDEIHENIQEQHENAHKTERIVKGKAKIPTLFIKITFHQNNLPEVIYL